uniref:Ectonucleotide pyrophosphatase/phosphodiesterase 1 n=1 Tax=Lates calcarifer TaxID=8187 RepID=A0A4W6EU68_LATCA
MEVTKGDERADEQGATLFGTTELESQRGNAERGKKRSKHCKIITGVLLLCLLVVILAVVLSLKNRSSGTEGDVWLQAVTEEPLQPQCPPGFSKSPLILVSLDGFRAEYLKDHRNHVPIINKLREAGTTTPYMRPVYPTKTFPNHYSIVTGLYPESHGIVDNKMYDVTRNAFFSLKTDEKFNPKWYQGEPVWVTAMRQKLKTGTFFWPGSDVAINGTFPNLYKVYDKYHHYKEHVVSHLQKSMNTTLDCCLCNFRPDFFTLYLDEPDTSGHRYGPASSQVVSALQGVDRTLGMLMDGLIERNLHNCVNLIIISDHGMEEASCEKAAFVSTYQENTDAFAVIQGPAARIRPTHLPEDYFSFDFDGLVKNLSCRTPNQPMRPYLKENLPKRMHFANNKRIERGHLYMTLGWQAALNRKELKYCTGGFHGSDNVFTNMQAIFIGYGPGFKNNNVVPPFENIEVYNLMCDLLGIRPSPNNGTHGSLNHLMKHPVHLPVHPAQLSHDSPLNFVQCFTHFPFLGAKVSLRRLHHPFGTPNVVQPDTSFCLLHHSDYLNGYSRDRLMPLWVSYTIQVRPLSPESEACVRADVRIPPAASQLCLRYRDNSNLSYGLLHPPTLSFILVYCWSAIRILCEFFPTTDVWTHFHDVLLLKYSQQLNGVNVMSGPIFDEDFDGNVDSFKAIAGNEAPIPTHFFVILTSCGNSTFSPVNCKGPLQAKSFILPHRPDHTESCATGSDLTWVEDWLHFHTARVRDIELLTGLSFYHDRLSVEETLQLKTFLPTA